LITQPRKRNWLWQLPSWRQFRDCARSADLVITAVKMKAASAAFFYCANPLQAVRCLSQKLVAKRMPRFVHAITGSCSRLIHYAPTQFLGTLKLLALRFKLSQSYTVRFPKKSSAKRRGNLCNLLLL
jgi:hypothetical protein